MQNPGYTLTREAYCTASQHKHAHTIRELPLQLYERHAGTAHYMSHNTTLQEPGSLHPPLKPDLFCVLPWEPHDRKLWLSNHALRVKAAEG